MHIQRFYTGIGSRETPADIQDQMTEFAQRMHRHKYVLRSGGADGADTAFEKGTDRADIFLPWSGFNGSTSRLYLSNLNPILMPEAQRLASSAHPVWNKLGPAVQKLHTGNVFQVLGRDLGYLSDFVLCWTPDGAELETETSSKTGGTRTAIVIACRYHVPVINMQRPDWKQRALREVKIVKNVE